MCFPGLPLVGDHRMMSSSSLLSSSSSLNSIIGLDIGLDIWSAYAFSLILAMIIAVFVSGSKATGDGGRGENDEARAIGGGVSSRSNIGDARSVDARLFLSCVLPLIADPDEPGLDSGDDGLGSTSICISSAKTFIPAAGVGETAI